MSQVGFALLLYLLGVAWGGLFRRSVPFGFICLTGFLWGAAACGAAALLLLTVGLPYTTASLLALAVFAGMGLVFFYVRSGLWRLTKVEALWLAAGSAAFGAWVALSVQFNVTQITDNSLQFLIVGRALAFDGLNAFTLEGLALRAALLPLLYAPSVFLGDGYLAVIQPAFAFTLLSAFVYLGLRALRSQLANPWLRVAVVGLSVGVMLSTDFMAYQAVYIHNNLPSAACLLVAAVTLWLALDEDNAAWLIFSVPAWLSFSLLRTEAPLFALLFILLALSSGRLNYRVRLIAFLPWAGVLLLWHVRLLIGIGAGTYILDASKLWIIVAALLAFVVLLAVSRWSWIERRLLPALPWLMMGAGLAALAGLAARQPDALRPNLEAFVRNLFVDGRWNATWFFLLGFWFLACVLPELHYGRVFSFGIPLFFLFVLLLGFLTRKPFRVGWGDSANRMFTHLLPFVLFYLLLKFTQRQGQSTRPD